MSIVERIGCLAHGHEYFWRNVYGDEVNALGGFRSRWVCGRCGKVLFSGDLHDWTEPSAYRIEFSDTYERPPETMVGERVYDEDGNHVGWVVV